MRDEPCGGTQDGACEVVDQPCIWVAVHSRAKAANRVDDLRTSGSIWTGFSIARTFVKP